MPGKKVMLVDDDVDLVEANRVLLESKGYTVVAAYSGRECLEKLESERPDLIVLDVMMATMSDGFDVARALRETTQTKSIPILMVTSVNEQVPYSFRPDPDWLPVDAFLEKPVPPQQLLDKIAAWLG